MTASAGRYALGVASLLVSCGALGSAAVTLRRRFFADWSGALARLGEAVIGLAMLIAILELLGAVGLFRLGPIVAACVLVGAAISRAAPAESRPRATVSSPLAATVAFVAAAVVLGEWASPTLQSYDVGIHGFDSLWYHLPWAADFAQSGQITPLRFTDVEYLTAFYPATAELFHGLGIVLLGRDTLSPAINLGWVALVLLAAWCVGRPRGLGVLTLLGAALAMATPMMDSSQAGSAANDVVGVFFLLAAVAFVIAGENRRAPLVLAAVAAGLAAAVKLSLLAPVLALTIGTIAIAPRGRRASSARWWLGPLVAAGGFWYVRNLIAVGNPLPWVDFGILATPANPLQQHTGFSVAHYIFNGTGWSRFFQPGLASGLGAWWWAILAGAGLGPILCLAARAGRTLRMLALVALASIIAYLLTPESAAGPSGDPAGFAFNLRYAAPALTLSLTLLPLVPPFGLASRPARLRIAAVLLSAVIVATVAKAPLWPTRHQAAAIGIGAAVLAVGVGSRWVRRIPRAALLVGLALLLVAGAAAGYFGQRHYLRRRYAFSPGVSFLARTWAFFRHVHDAQVGVVGTFGGFFSYPLFGVDDSNRVRYVAHRGPHGSFAPIKRCAEWRRAVNASHFRYLVTTPARDPWHPKVLSYSPEESWTASDPAVRPVLSRTAVGQPITVFLIRGVLDPSGCR